MSTVDFRDLSADDQQRLLLSPGRSVQLGCEVLDSGLTFVKDISSALVPGSGSIDWNAPTDDEPDGVEWGCSATLTLAEELDATALVRFSKTITDRVTGLSARSYMGVFLLSWPERTTGTWVRGDDGSKLLPFAVTGQDRTAVLDWPPGYSYVALAVDGSGSPVKVLDAVKQVFIDAGIPLSGVLIDGSRATAVMPETKTWPLISDDSGGQSTWRQILTDLLALVAYQPPYMDNPGYIRCTPDFDPVTATPSARFAVDMGAGWVSPIAQQRTRARDLATVPNQETFIWEDMVDGSGNPVTPTTGNGGILTLTNATVGPTCIDALGGYPAGVRPKTTQLSAASMDDFTQQAQLQAVKDLNSLTQYKVNTVTWLPAGHRDVFAYNDPDTTDTDSDLTVTPASWSSPLSDEDTSWVWNEVTTGWSPDGDESSSSSSSSSSS